MIKTYINYINNEYDTKKWFIDENRADAIVSIIGDKLPKELVQTVIDNCYEEIVIPYSGNWINNKDVLSNDYEAYILNCDTDDIKNLRIIFDRFIFGSLGCNEIRSYIISSNHTHFSQGSIKYTNNSLICSRLNSNNIRRNCEHFLDISKSNITLLYKRISYTIT